MIIHAFFCGIILICHCLLGSGFIPSSVRPVGSLQLLKDPREFEYVLKRSKEHEITDQDSKERRSHMGSSIIRYGRSRKSDINDLADAGDYTMEHPQTRSDVIIRYGRSEKKNSRAFDKSLRCEPYFVRYERRIVPIDLDLSLICKDYLINEETFGENSPFYSPQLAQICNDLMYKQRSYNDVRLDLKQE